MIMQCAQKVAAFLGLGSYSTYSTVFSSSILTLLIEQNKSLSCLLSNWCMFGVCLVHVGVCWCITGDCQAPTYPSGMSLMMRTCFPIFCSHFKLGGDCYKYKKVAPQIGRTCYCS
jgi:hypothetical protein